MRHAPNDEVYFHHHPQKVGLLLTNLGTPAAATPKALRRYLREFLGDPRVVEIPRFLWWIILRTVVLPLRPRRSAKAYQKIWQATGSPLLLNTQAISDALAKRLQQRYNADLVVNFAMRYGSPALPEVLADMRAQGVSQLIVLPLYPQYSAATTGSTFDKITQVLSTWRWVPGFHMVNHYADHPAYLRAQAKHIRDFWEEQGRAEKLILSFHGLPKQNLKKGDPYYCFCHKTARLLAAELKLQEDEWLLCFQSRFGAAEWLQPYLDKTLEQLPAQGVRTVQVVCPGFAADCLETLEEVALQNQELFLSAGGAALTYIPALNASEVHIDALQEIVTDYTPLANLLGDR